MAAPHRPGGAAEGLREEVDAGAGKGFVGEVDFAHAAYGVAPGITAKHETSEENVAMGEPLRALAAAIAEYGLRVGAQYRGSRRGDEGGDPGGAAADRRTPGAVRERRRGGGSG
ncbi:MAG: hypothetical protein Q8S73_02155 [Deltaproteobacteria bacterium]|nr:hypothetical protein [Deltaproteobacteria bacterium]